MSDHHAPNQVPMFDLQSSSSSFRHQPNLATNLRRSLSVHNDPSDSNQALPISRSTPTSSSSAAISTPAATASLSSPRIDPLSNSKPVYRTSIELASYNPLQSKRDSTGSETNVRLRERVNVAASARSRLSVDIDRMADSLQRNSSARGYDASRSAYSSRRTSRDASRLDQSQTRSVQDTNDHIRHGDDREGNDDDDDDDEPHFVKKSRNRNTSSTILPPAGFFAPKKPSAHPGSHILTSPALHAGSFRSDPPRVVSPFQVAASLPLNPTNDPAVSNQDAANQEVLTQRHHTPLLDSEPFSANESMRSPSPWGMAASAHSMASSTCVATHYPDNDRERVAASSVSTFDTTRRSHDLKAKRAMTSTSTDPLIPAKAHVANIPNPYELASAFNPPAPLPKTASIRQSVINQPSRDSLLPGGAVHPPSATPSLRSDSATNQGFQRGASDSHKHNHVASQTAIAIPPSLMPRKRKHVHHGGSNRFLLGGLIMTSGANPLPFLGSLVLMATLSGLFFGFEAPWLCRHFSPGSIAVFTYIWLLAVVNMLVTAWKDPGILPRNMDPDPPCTLGESHYSDAPTLLADPNDPLAIPVKRIVRIRGHDVKVKWCETCGTYRPPRSSHCRMCDNCVENIDHHCTYLNTCIGRRNYVSFLVFLATSILSDVMVAAFSAVHLALLTKPTSYQYPGGGYAPGLTFVKALAQTPVSAILFLLTLGVLCPLVTLFGYHVRLILVNRTTVEDIRIKAALEYGEKQFETLSAGDDDSVYGATRRANPLSKCCGLMLKWIGLGGLQDRHSNPFATSKCSRNIRNSLGWRAVTLDSWIDRRGWYQEDRRLPNPGLSQMTYPLQPAPEPVATKLA